MNLSCSTLCCELPSYPHISDALTKIKTLGFHTIDLAVFEDWQNVNPSTLAQPDETWSAEFLIALEKSGLKVSSLNSKLSAALNTPDQRQDEQIGIEFDALVKLAVAAGSPNITVQPGNPISGYTVETLVSLLSARLRKLAPVCLDRGITLSVEGHQGSILEDPAVALEFVRSIWPVVGFTYDPSHWTMQDIALPDTEALLDYSYHIHVRNASTHNMQETMVDGKVDFRWLINALNTHQYHGAVAIEYFSGYDGEFVNTLALRDVLLTLGVKHS